MITIEQFSRIVTAVHDAAVEPSRWVDAMSLTRTTLNGTGCGLITGGSDRDIACCSVPDTEAMQTYSEHFRPLDYVLDAVESGPLGLVHSGERLVALNPRSEFYADWMRRYAMDDGVFVRLTGGSQPHSFLVAAPRRDESFASSDNVRAANALVPHLQTALRTQQSLAELRTEALHGPHPADTFSAPAAVVDADMTVASLNSGADALLRCGTEVFVRSGRVRLLPPSADVELRRAVSRAIGPRRTAQAVAVPRATSVRPLIVHVLPLAASEGSHSLLVVVDPDLRREPPKRLLRQLFSLTNSEAEVALQISRGRGLSAIADELTLSTATVKTHLQHVYQKTDTHKQAELTRLLLTLMP
ncbi:LuxR C-terminal-related transcriptional regulator [Mycolicibacterium sp. BiH015]|uniref:PAS and helix-turn-helix domain-containing protein n=1 Tax=Mycolicibacterium sp. BiH015 TaxID=3018808 RepID=UPI0022E7F0B5|nr:PAS and helix-turn-helix domain-containing protein [Mycolicibacterium sp. BiH015]MDA2891667.1 LuxR C-terminal-related transcriptional regulator [Mycolicibacterium sp. BiH015]